MVIPHDVFQLFKIPSPTEHWIYGFDHRRHMDMGLIFEVKQLAWEVVRIRPRSGNHEGSRISIMRGRRRWILWNLLMVGAVGCIVWFLQLVRRWLWQELLLGMPNQSTSISPNQNTTLLHSRRTTGKKYNRCC